MAATWPEWQPLRSIRIEPARGVSLVPIAQSPFTQKWEQAVASYFRGNYREAARTLMDAERIMPGFPDLMRLHLETQMRAEGESRFRVDGVTIGVSLGAVVLIVLTVGVGQIVKRGRRRTAAGVRRIAPNHLRSQLEAGTATLVDARRQPSFEKSSVRAVGALRYDIEAPNTQQLELHVGRDDEVVVYCDCPDEATSTQVALQLMQAGYRHVTVVRGGFRGLTEAGIAMVPNTSAQPIIRPIHGLS